MKLSVVIPAYNEEAFLPHLLESLKKQTVSKQDYEVIVVDNNSTDKTAEIARRFGARVISEKHRGYAYACNAGFAAAKGEIIARADADYVQPKDWLEKIDKAFQKDSKLVALGGPLYPLESTVLENIVYYPGIILWMFILKSLGRGFLFPNMAMKQEMYKKTGGFDTNLEFGEDTEMCLALKKLGKVAYIPSIYVYTSIRKMRSLGFVQSVVGYSIGNHIAMWRGKKATVGLEIVRSVPSSKPRQYAPWIFLFPLPMLLVLLFFYIVISSIPPKTTQQLIITTTETAQLIQSKILPKTP